MLHTTESDTFTPESSTYFGHESYPHFTITQQGPTVEIYQHITIAKAARALLDPPGGAETNRAIAIQIEIVGRARHAASFSDLLLLELARWMRWVEEKTGVEPEAPLALRGSEASGASGVARMSAAQWNAFDGWCGHQHVPENEHWDPGLIPIQRLLVLGRNGDRESIASPGLSADERLRPIPSVRLPVGTAQ